MAEEHATAPHGASMERYNVWFERNSLHAVGVDHCYGLMHQFDSCVCVTMYKKCRVSCRLARFSSRIFKLVSHATVIYIVLAAYVVRFLAFSFLTHAWSALPLELLHGVTYSLMWAAASSTANQMALPGTQASCQAIAGAVYWDLG